MENSEYKKKWDAVVGAAAIGAAGLPLLWLATMALHTVFKKGLIADLAFVVLAYLSIPLAFGIFGIAIQGLVGATMFGIVAFYWYFILKP